MLTRNFNWTKSKTRRYMYRMVWNQPEREFRVIFVICIYNVYDLFVRIVQLNTKIYQIMITVPSWYFQPRSKIPRRKFFHKNFLMREFSPSDIWIDVFRKFCCDINKYHICLVFVCFGECTWPVAFERTHLQGLTHSRSWDIWLDVHVVFRWFQPYGYFFYPIHG